MPAAAAAALTAGLLVPSQDCCRLVWPLLCLLADPARSTSACLSGTAAALAGGRTPCCEALEVIPALTSLFAGSDLSASVGDLAALVLLAGGFNRLFASLVMDFPVGGLAEELARGPRELCGGWDTSSHLLLLEGCWPPSGPAGMSPACAACRVGLASAQGPDCIACQSLPNDGSAL